MEKIRVVSVVWHAGAFDSISLLKLLEDEGWIVIVTFNNPSDFWKLKLTELLRSPHIIQNSTPKSFGENHNASFMLMRSDFFLVLNPDIKIECTNVELLLEPFRYNDDLKILGPVLKDQSGHLFIGRSEISVFNFFTRRILHRRTIEVNRFVELGRLGSYFSVDAISGAFMIIRSIDFAAIEGFDERFFMYCEDLDLCRRMRYRGGEVGVHPSFYCLHIGGYMSHRSLRYFLIHLRSLLLYFFGPIKNAKKFR